MTVSVYLPDSEPGPISTSLAASPASLKGLRIAVLDNGKPNADVVMIHAAEALAGRTGAVVSVITKKGPLGQSANAAIPLAEDRLALLLAEADIVIRIQRDRSGRRVLSVSARNTPQEYEIFYVVEYSVERAGKEVLEAQPLEILRNMSFDDAQLLAKDREEAILREAMARDLALLVVRRLESL